MEASEYSDGVKLPKGALALTADPRSRRRHLRWWPCLSPSTVTLRAATLQRPAAWWRDRWAMCAHLACKHSPCCLVQIPVRGATRQTKLCLHNQLKYSRTALLDLPDREA